MLAISFEISYKIYCEFLCKFLEKCLKKLLKNSQVDFLFCCLEMRRNFLIIQYFSVSLRFRLQSNWFWCLGSIFLGFYGLYGVLFDFMDLYDIFIGVKLRVKLCQLKTVLLCRSKLENLQISLRFAGNWLAHVQNSCFTIQKNSVAFKIPRH